MHRSPFFYINSKTRNIAVLFGLVTLIEGILWYFMPIYFESKLNSLFLVGVILSSHPIASLFASLPAGDLCDKLGKKFVFILGLLGFAASFLFLFWGNFQAFLFFMIMYGIFSTMYGISAFVFVLDHARPHIVGESAGFFTSVNYAGWLFGSLIAGVLMLLFDVTFMLKILMLSVLLILSFAIFLFPGKTHINLDGFKRAKNILWHDGLFFGEARAVYKLGKPLIAIFAFSFVFGYWEYAIWTFEPIYANSLGSGILLGAAILALISLPGAVSALIAGKLLDSLGVKKILPIGAVLILLGQAIFLFQQSLITLAISLVLTSFGAMFILIIIDYYIKERVTRNLRGEVDGAAEMLYNIGGIFGPLTIGAVLTVAELGNLFYFTTALFIAAITTLVFLKDI